MTLRSVPEEMSHVASPFFAKLALAIAACALSATALAEELFNVAQTSLGATAVTTGAPVNKDWPGLRAIPKEDPRNMRGGTLFGVSGGVTEAVLRYILPEALDEAKVEDLGFGQCITLEAEDKTLRIAVVSGLKNARTLLEKVEKGEESFALIEVMACPGGCVNGGGQPIVPSSVRNWTDIRVARAKALYDEDASKTLRKSHLNPEIKAIYEEYLGKPNSHKAHEILHTTYVKRGL